LASSSVSNAASSNSSLPLSVISSTSSLLHGTVVSHPGLEM
jgi:hypothetical protein